MVKTVQLVLVVVSPPDGGYCRERHVNWQEINRRTTIIKSFHKFYSGLYAITSISTFTSISNSFTTADLAGGSSGKYVLKILLKPGK